LPSPTAKAPLQEWLRWQEHLHPRAIALGLERIRPVAQRLGLPAKGPRTVTVAGTNGKGSSTVLLAEIYGAAGYRTGTYTSPHLLRYNERVAVEGKAVADEDFGRAFAAVEAARGDVALTYFEFGTLAALWLLREAKVDVQVLEVGMGGRLDAVNLVDADAAYVTSIGLDHTEFLGTNREQIGGEKAGVFRAGRPAVCADARPPRSIAARARDAGATLRQLGRDFRYRKAADFWHWQGWDRAYRKLPPPALAGEAQFRNAAGAIAVTAALQDVLPVPETAIRAGLVRLSLPGRFERHGNVILDVAHNVEAGQALAENLRLAGIRGTLRVVLGMLSDKPVEGFVAAVAPLAGRIYAGGLPPPRGLDGVTLAERARKADVEVHAFRSVGEAFEAAYRDAGPDDVILACGSFLTVAAVMELLRG